MSVASVGQTGLAVFRKICDNFCVIFSLVGFFLPTHPPRHPHKRHGFIWTKINLENLARED